MPGSPERVDGIVYVSQRYIARGSSVFEPNSKATDGEVGVSITSHDAYAAAKSSAMRRRTLSARP